MRGVSSHFIQKMVSIRLSWIIRVFQGDMKNTVKSSDCAKAACEMRLTFCSPCSSESRDLKAKFSWHHNIPTFQSCLSCLLHTFLFYLCSRENQRKVQSVFREMESSYKSPGMEQKGFWKRWIVNICPLF